jgi:hypothetical protein
MTLDHVYDSALNLAALAQLLAEELCNRFFQDKNADGPDIAAIATLLSDRLAAHRDSLEALVDSTPSLQSGA